MKRLKENLMLLSIVILLTACTTDGIDVKDGTYIMQITNESGATSNNSWG